MKVKALVFCLGLLSAVCPFDVQSQQQWNLPLLARWDDDSIPQAWTGAYSECGGYADDSGREYAYIGSTKGIYFFDITDPENPVQVGYFTTKDTAVVVVNKDFAVYSHYVYAVSDQGDNSLQIFDMQYLPDSVVKVYDSNALSKRAHTLFVEKDRLYVCSNSRPDNSFGAMDVFSLADPLDPQLLGTLFNPGFFTVHETFVRNDTAWCANGNSGLWVYDMSDPAFPSLISYIDLYPEEGYNHSGWLSADSKTLYFTDENHGKGVKVYDVSDAPSPELKQIFRSNLLNVSDPQSSNGSVAHNPFIRDDKLFVAYYHDGVQVYDLSDPWQPELIGYYDTYPENDTYYSYAGCWGVYPFLPSGTIIASDIKNGLILLDGRGVLGYEPEVPVPGGIQIAGNPVTDWLTMNFFLEEEGVVDIEVFDVTGRLVHTGSYDAGQGNSTVNWNVSSLASGTYYIRGRSSDWKETLKMLKVPSR